MSLLSTFQQYNICATCLALVWDDQLYPFTEELTIILKHLLHDFDLDDCLKLVPPDNGLKLCGLCLKTLRDIYFFKLNVLKSLNHLKKQWEICFQTNQTEQNTPQSLPEDEIVVTTKEEIKQEPDPLETPKIFVVSHTTPESNVSVDIKEESHIDNDDHTNADSNLDTELADSVDLDDDITKSCIPKTVNFASALKGNNQSSVYRIASAAIDKAYSSNLNSENKKKLMIEVKPLVRIARNVKGNNQSSVYTIASAAIEKAYSSNLISENKKKLSINTVKSLVRIAPKPDPSFGKTSDSSYMAVENQPFASSNVGPSVFPVANSQPQVGSNTSAKEQSDTQSRDTPCSDEESDSGAEERRGKKNYTKPWYITPLTREQLVKIREDTLKDPYFAKAVHKCIYCARIFTHKDKWKQHKGHCEGRSKENAEFSCFVCGLSYDTLALLCLHQRYHDLGHHTYQCPTCDFTTNDLVRRHRCPNEGGEKVPPKDPTMKLVSGRRQFYCPACDYVSFKGIIPHYHRYHTTVPVKCDVCGKSSKNLDALNQHKQREHSGKPPPEKKEYMFCAPCVKSFYSKAGYEAHMMTVKHAPKDQLNISCDECSKKFHLQELYEKHKRSHELIRNGAKPHKCTQCGLSYVFKTTLRAHMRTKHTEREIKRDHICEVCGDGFSSGEILRGHMATHSDARPHKCEYCGDTFKQSGARYTHIKLKHNKKKPKPDDENKATSKSGKHKKRRKGKCDAHEQSEDTHEHEQKMGTEEHEQRMGTDEQSMDSQEHDQSMDHGL